MKFKTLITLLLIIPFLFANWIYIPQNKNFRKGKDYALFFVVEDYDEWEDLQFPIDDAEEIAGMLEDAYDFETRIIKNPTKQRIDQVLRRYIKRQYEEDAQLLIWFGGHGNFDDVLKEGYFIPKDGEKESALKWFSFIRLQQYLKNIPCNHILLSIDACYAGTFDEVIAMRGKKKRKFGRPKSKGKTSRNIYVEQELKLKTKLFIASGKKEQVPDESDFANYFKKALIKHGGEDYIVSFTELEVELEKSKPKPHISEFEGNQEESNFLFVGKIREKPTESDFVFVGDELIKFDKNDKDYQLWNVAISTNDLDLLKKHEELFPKSPLRNEREKAIKKLTTAPPIPPFVFVEGGDFNMGCVQGQLNACKADEKPTHKVKLTDFYIGRYEVTNEEFCAFLNEEGNHQTAGFKWIDLSSKYCKIKKRKNQYSPEFGFEKHPAIEVSWYGANSYASWMSKKKGNIYRLPTEAEWEYAARGGLLSKGYKFAGSDTLENVAWYYSNSGVKTHTVGEKKPNELDVFDMNGNVWEWCSDWYDMDYYKNKKEENPRGPKAGVKKVVRGGSWLFQIEHHRLSNRSYFIPSKGNYDLGFRLVKEL